jgi:hypothetical protein
MKIGHESPNFARRPVPERGARVVEYLPCAVLLVDVLQVLLVEHESGVILVHLLLQLSELGNHDALMVPTHQCPLIALDCSVVGLQMLV